MGIVFGRTGALEPTYRTLYSNAYQIREYNRVFVAEIASSSPGGKDSQGNNSFRELASYIGVFGEPQNTLGSQISMTAPVITESEISKSKSIAMTAPVISTENEQDTYSTMSFVLPEEFKAIEDVPIPRNPNISIKEIPGRIVAVKAFSGWYSSDVGKKNFEALRQELEQSNILFEGTVSDSTNSLKWSVAQYHPPFTIPFLRRNEIWIELDRAKTLAMLKINDTD